MLDCVTGALIPYVPSSNMPWNQMRALHLSRRLGFGFNRTELNTTLNVSDPSQFIINQINSAASVSPDPEPFWADYVYSDFSDFNEMLELAFGYIIDWPEKMLEKGLRERMILFWSNHFVTQFDVYEYGPFMYRYYNTVEQHAFGNFKTFTREIGLSQAMLLYLNGAENTKFEPNENYARELYELFTLGVDNGYTQNDIVETARALTGWTLDENTYAVQWVQLIHDEDPKTIFGQTGNYDYDGVIDLLFTERATEIANHVCGQIYKNFVNPVIDENIVSELATTFINANWELLPVYHQLFSSEHFFDEHHISTIVKSPADTIVTFSKEFGFDINITLPDDPDTSWRQIIYYVMQSQGQALFSPTDVAGWQGNRAWLNSNNLTSRWQVMDSLTYFAWANYPDLLRDLAIELSDNSNDPTAITFAIVDYFCPKGLQTSSAYDTAVDVFKWEIPQNYFDNGQWNLTWDEAILQTAFLIQHISRLPEFQLS